MCLNNVFVVVIFILAIVACCRCALFFFLFIAYNLLSVKAADAAKMRILSLLCYKTQEITKNTSETLSVVIFLYITHLDLSEEDMVPSDTLY